MALRDALDGPLSLRQAARQAGCSKDTLWRAVRRGELNAAEVLGPKGRQLVLDRTEFDQWMKRRSSATLAVDEIGAYNARDTVSATLAAQRVGDAANEASQATNMCSTVATNAADAALQESVRSALASNAVFRETVTAAHSAQPTVNDSADTADTVDVAAHAAPPSSVDAAQPVVPLEAHLRTLELLQDAQARAHESQEESRRLERQVLALQVELSRYRLALTENAESLVEREARAREAEARAQEAERQLKDAESSVRDVLHVLLPLPLHPDQLTVLQHAAQTLEEHSTPLDGSALPFLPDTL